MKPALARSHPERGNSPYLLSVDRALFMRSIDRLTGEVRCVDGVLPNHEASRMGQLFLSPSSLQSSLLERPPADASPSRIYREANCVIGEIPAVSAALAFSGRQAMNEHTRPSPSLSHACIQNRVLAGRSISFFEHPCLFVPGGWMGDEAMFDIALLLFSAVTSRIVRWRFSFGSGQVHH